MYFGSVLQCCCSVLQCVVVCCRVLQLTYILGVVCCCVCCGVLRCVAVCCGVLQCVAACCSVLQSVIVDICTWCSMLLCVLQCVIVCCSVLQRVAECYSWRMYFGTDAPGIVETFSKVSSTFLVFEFYLSITSTLQHIATHCNAPINSFNRRLNVTQIGLFFARAWYVAQVSLWRPYEFVTVSSWNSYDFVTFACAWYVRHIFTLLSDILMWHMSVLDIHVSSWHICYYICVLTCWPAHVFTLLPHIPQYMTHFSSWHTHEFVTYMLLHMCS